MHSIHWNLIILDEYHFGAWNDNAKSLLDLGDADAKRRQAEEDAVLGESGSNVESRRAWYDEEIPITGKHFLYLSGTFLARRWNCAKLVNVDNAILKMVGGNG